MEKETSERESSGADVGAVKGTVTATVIPCEEIGVHISIMSVSSFTRQGKNTVMRESFSPFDL